MSVSVCVDVSVLRGRRTGAVIDVFIHSFVKESAGLSGIAKLSCPPCVYTRWLVGKSFKLAYVQLPVVGRMGGVSPPVN